MADLKELVLSRIDIADLIGQYVTLKPAGREFKACCPFHDEKTASFTISPEKGFFHCFGCKAGGTVVDFVMRMENLEFRDALEWLANRYNIEIPAYKGGGQKRGEKERLFDINEAALKFFRQSLKDADATAVQEYLTGRGISSSQAAEFDLGYAPRSWQALTDLLLSRGAKAAELTKLGLIKERRESSTGSSGEGAGHYDTFRHRLIFPIRAVTGRVIGFAGRSLSKEDTPKYMNVTNTPLYDKSRALYNLDRAKGLIRTEGAVVVEGYMDVIGLQSAGIGNAIATCGTALTDEHIKLLLRYGDRFYLAFDGDRAGREAAWKAGRMFLLQGIDARVVSFPEGQDPDDFARENGVEGWQRLLTEAKGVARFWLDHQLAAQPNPDLTTQREFVEQLAPLYQQLGDELIRQQIKRDMASALQLSANEVVGLLKGNSQPKMYYKNPKAELQADIRRTSLMQGAEPTEQEVLRRILVDDEFQITFKVVGDPEWFTSTRLRNAYNSYVNSGGFSGQSHDAELTELYAEICAKEPSFSDNETIMRKFELNFLRIQILDKTREIANKTALPGFSSSETKILGNELVNLKAKEKILERLLVNNSISRPQEKTTYKRASSSPNFSTLVNGRPLIDCLLRLRDDVLEKHFPTSQEFEAYKVMLDELPSDCDEPTGMVLKLKIHTIVNRLGNVHRLFIRSEQIKESVSEEDLTLPGEIIKCLMGK